jgi:hypothetical protein
MKTLNTYTPNELKDVARRNYHTIIKMLTDAGIKPILQHPHGTRMHSYYGTDALDFVTQIRAAEDAKKADKLARKQAWAAKRAAAAEKKAEAQKRKEEREARIAAGLPVHGGRKEEKARVKKETPIDVIREQLTLPLDNGPSLRELVTETNNLLRQMLEFWKGN